MNMISTGCNLGSLKMLRPIVVVLLLCISSMCGVSSASATETSFSSYIEEDNKTCSFLISEEKDRYLEIVALAGDTLDFRLYAEEPEGWWITTPSTGKTITLTLLFSDGSSFKKVGDIEDYSQRPSFKIPTDVFRRIARTTELSVKLDEKEILKATELNSLTDAQLLLNCATSLILSDQPNMQ